MKNRPYIPQAEAARELNCTVQSVKRLMAGQLLSVDPANNRKVSQADVDALLIQKKLSIPERRPVLRVPLAPEKLGPSMYYLPGKNTAEIREYDDYLEEADREHLTHKLGERVYSGAWQISDEDASLLVREGGIICGAVVGWTNQAAEIIDHVKNIPYLNRKIFVVRPFQGDELAPWQAYLPSNAQGPQMLR